MKRLRGIMLSFVALALMFSSCDEKEDDAPEGNKILRIMSARIGKTTLSISGATANMPTEKPIVLSFNVALDTATVLNNIRLKIEDSTQLDFSVFFFEGHQTISIFPEKNLKHQTSYLLNINEGLKGKDGESFSATTLRFITEGITLRMQAITMNNKNFDFPYRLKDIDFQVKIKASFNAPIRKEGLENYIRLAGPSGDLPVSISLSNQDSSLVVQNDTPLDYYREYTFHIETGIKSPTAENFKGFSNHFHTRLDTTDKFPRISDAELLTKVQRQTFRYFWDFAHPDCGMARERNTSNHTVTGGGSAFGIMSIIVGMERAFITRDEGIQRMQKILNFLENDADRFHGAWPHWMHGSTGKVIPFSPKDNGGDLVETGYMAQALLTFRQYLNSAVSEEQILINQINRLWESIEWDWYTQGEDVLYWHWSPEYKFEKDLPIRGHNETQIIYVLAASSPTHPINAKVYHQGYARGGAIQNGNTYYGHILPLGNAYGGPLFFTHYSYLGMDPRDLQDDYADYWTQNRNHALIHQDYCKDNPNNYIGYGEHSWGLTASDNHQGYSAHSPTNDLGVITPTAAVSSLPYTPKRSMDAIRHFYYKLGDRLWGPYGFYDAFNPTEDWYADSYLAIDQGPIICMIENHRTGLLWNLFMSAPEIQNGLDKLGFSY